MRPQTKNWDRASHQKCNIQEDQIQWFKENLLLKNLNNDLPLINIGSGKEITIKNLANLIRDIVGFNGDLIFDTSQPDGTPKKLICNRTLTRLGWAPKINLQDGLERTYQCFLDEQTTERLN